MPGGPGLERQQLRHAGTRPQASRKRPGGREEWFGSQAFVIPTKGLDLLREHLEVLAPKTIAATGAL